MGTNIEKAIADIEGQGFIRANLPNCNKEQDNFWKVVNELSEWFISLEHPYKTIVYGGHFVYFKSEDETDMMAFKLRWM